MSGYRQATFKTVVYGKIVDPVRGALEQGAGYAWIGRSCDVMADERDLCVPSHIGLSGKADPNWSGYPWPKRGGLVVRPAYAGGRWIFVAGRIRPRSEAGEGKAGRLFTQSNYLIGNVEEIENPLLAIPEDLVAEPLTKIDSAIPARPARVYSAELLPPDWFNPLVRECLRRVISGYRVAVVDPNLSPDRFLTDAQSVMCCLPRALRWRFSIGAGFLRVPQEVDLGHGLDAEPGLLRLEKDVWEPNDSSLELQTGNSYLLWLEKVVIKKLREACPENQTYERLDQALHQDLDSFRSFDYPAKPRPDRPLPQWETCHAELIGHARDSVTLHELGDWLDGCASSPPHFDEMSFFRAAAITQVVLAAADQKPGEHRTRYDRAQDLLEVFEDRDVVRGKRTWRTDLENAAQTENPAGREILLAFQVAYGWAAATPQRLICLYSLNLPKWMHANLANSIEEALHQPSADITQWAEFLVEATKETAGNWMAAVCLQLDLLLAKLVFDLSVKYNQQCVEHWKYGGATAAVLSILRPNPPDEINIEALFNAVSGWNKKDLIAICNKAYDAKAYATAIVVAKFVQNRHGSVNGWDQDYGPFRPTGNRGPLLRQIAQAVHRHPCFEVLFEIAIKNHSQLSPDDSKEVGRLLGPLLGKLGYILYGTQSVDQPQRSLEQVALPWVIQKMTVNPEVLERAFDCCSNNRGSYPQLEESLLWTIAEPPAGLGPLPESLDFVHRAMFNQKKFPLPSLTCQQAAFTTRLVAAFTARQLGTNDVYFLPPKDQITDVGNLRAYVATCRHSNELPLMDDHLLAQTVGSAMVDNMEQEFWRQQLQRLNATDCPRWRLLVLRPTADGRRTLTPAPNELAVIRVLSSTDQERLSQHGWKLPDGHMPSTTPN